MTCSGGVATNASSAGLHAIMIEGGGHHLDLMFSHPADPPAVKVNLAVARRRLCDVPSLFFSRVLCFWMMEIRFM